MEESLGRDKKFCACGCKEVIECVDKWGKPRNYKAYHALRGFKHSEKSLEKMRQTRLMLINAGKLAGETHPSWKGGRWFSSHGYAKVWVGKDNLNADKDGYVYEHTLQLQKYLCKALTKNEIGHHENKIKDDNRIGRGGNLHLMTKSQHMELHGKKQKSQLRDLSKRHIKGSRQRWFWLFR